MDINLKAEEFEKKVLQASKPVLVDFFADWCGPCKTLGPMIDQIAEIADGSAYVYKLNIDESSSVAAQYGVRSVPTVITFENGKETKRFTGVVHPKNYLDAIGIEFDTD